MKTVSTLIAVWLFTAMFFLPKVNAQCPPAGFAPLVDICEAANVFCSDIGSYCDTLGFNNIYETFPGCPSSVLNNKAWFKFVATSDSIAVRITPSNCLGLNLQFGMQGAIYTDCGGAALATQCNCTTSPFILASGNFNIGATYVVVLDGCAGDVCAYEIEVIYGSTDGTNTPFPSVGQIVGAGQACLNTISTYTVEDYAPGLVYNWTTEPSGAADILVSDSLATFVWLDTGQFNICLQLSNDCSTSEDIVCKTVVVTTLTILDTVYVDLCQGQCFDLPDGQTVCDDGVYEVLIAEQFSCDTLRTYFVVVSANPVTDLGQQVACGDSFTICVDSSFYENGTYTLNCPTAEGCDSLVTFHLTLLHPQAVLKEPGILCLPGEVLDGSASQFSEGNGILRQVSWEGPAGGLVLGPDSLLATATLPGIYCLTVYEEIYGQRCQHTACVEVNTIQIGLPDSIQLCQGEFVPIQLSPDTYISFLWSTGDTTNAIDVTSSGVYSVLAADTAGCVHYATFEVIISDEPYTGLPDTASICLNGVIEVEAAAGFAHYVWDNGQVMPSTNFYTPGWHYLTVSTAGGCVIQDSLYLVELPVEDPGLSSIPICTTDYPFPVTAASGFVSYAWSNGDSTQTASFDSAGIYQLTALQSNGCLASDEITLVAEEFYVLNYPDTLSVCEQVSPITLSLPAEYKYHWSNGSTSHSVTLEELMTYSVTVTNDTGCVQADTFFLTAKPNVELQDEYYACSNNFPVIISVNPVYAAYQWNNGTVTPQLSAHFPGIYQVTVTGSFGCTATASTEVVSVPAAQVSLGANELELCEEAFPYHLMATGIWDELQWSTGASTPSIDVYDPGVYSVTVSNSAGCTDQASILINQLPPPMLQNPLGDTTICIENLPITFDAGPGQALYLWSTGDNTRFTSLDNSDIQEPGFYLISLLFKDQDGCQAVESFVVEAEVCNATSQAFLPGIFSLRPNPANGEARLVYSGLPSGNYRLSIYQTQGKLLWQQDFVTSAESGEYNLPVARLASGVYFIQLASQQGVAVLKLIIAGG